MRRTIRRLDNFKSHLSQAYQFAEMGKHTDEWLRDTLQREVWAHEHYKRLTQYERGYLQGRRDALDNRLWQEHTIWRLGPQEGPLPEHVDGWKVASCCQVALKLNGKKCPICQHDLTSGSACVLGELSRVPGALYGAHFWKGTDKPFTAYHCINRPRCQREKCLHDDTDHIGENGACIQTLGRVCECKGFIGHRIVSTEVSA